VRVPVASTVLSPTETSWKSKTCADATERLPEPVKALPRIVQQADCFCQKDSPDGLQFERVYKGSGLSEHPGDLQRNATVVHVPARRHRERSKVKGRVQLRGDVCELNRLSEIRKHDQKHDDGDREDPHNPVDHRVEPIGGSFGRHNWSLARRISPERRRSA
jgi:hypothetical protein